MNYYSGIGARKTPEAMIRAMKGVAHCMAEEGYVLRSGHAPGADQAFESGAAGVAEIFLPWESFCREITIQGRVYPKPSLEAISMAADLIPHWTKLSPAGRLLHARNCHQILGPELDDPVEFVVCWTPGGRQVGGTATGIRLAREHGITVYNLGRSADLRSVSAWLD